jgi:hypothetical protein
MQDDLNRRQTGMSRNTMMAIAAIIAVLVVGFLWAPWNTPRVVENSGTGTTVGSNTRPVTPVAPTAPAPDTPAAPSTNR